MMDRLQLLLGKLAEEASEISKIALKAQQFGLDEVQPGKIVTNAQRAHQEIHELMAIIKMLNDEFDFGYKPNVKRMRAKITKVNLFANYSVQLGQVEPAGREIS